MICRRPHTGVGKLMKYVFKFTAVLWLLLSLAGCASPSAAVKNASPLSLSRPIALDFILVETSSAIAGLEPEQRTLSDAIVSGLNDTGLFSNVSTNKADAGLGNGIKIKAEIKEIKQVSADARTWIGSWAGQARILAQVTVSDLPSGYQIETFQAEGKSGKSAWAGTTDEAVQLAAGRIVAEVVKINSQTAQ